MKYESTARPAPAGNRAAVAAPCAVQVVDVLGVTVLVSALPRILTSLDAPPSMAGLLASSYAMTFGGLLMLGARLGERFAHRRVLLAGLLLFAFASAVAGVAPSLALLVGARSLQGAAAAMSVPSALRLLSDVTESEAARRRALGAWSAGGAAAGAAGLIIGGLLTSLTGWRAVFWMNLPLATLLILAVLRTVPPGRRRPELRLEAVGSLPLAIGLMGLILGGGYIEQRQSRWLALTLLSGGVVLLAIFTRAQRRAREPLIPRAAARLRRCRLGAAAAFLNTATTSSLVTLATLYLQNTRHETPAAAALALLPFSVSVALGSTIAGRLVQHREPVLGLVAGFGLIAAGNGATLLPAGAQVLLPVCAGLAGAGIGLSSVAATATGTDVPEHVQGAAAGILNTSAQLGTALGVSAAVLLASVTEHSGLAIHGPFLSWTIAAVFAGGGALMAVRELRRRAGRGNPQQRPGAVVGADADRQGELAEILGG